MSTLTALTALLATAVPSPAAPLPPAVSISCENIQPAGSSTQPAGSVWQGLFVLNRGESDNLDEIADQAASRVRRRAQSRVRDALRDRLEASECLRLSDDAKTIAIESEQGVRWRVNRDGGVEAGGGQTKGSRTYRATVSDAAITITGTGEKGEARYQLTRSSDGKRLELAVSVSAKRLDSPIAYKLVYDRQSGGGAS